MALPYGLFTQAIFFRAEIVKFKIERVNLQRFDLSLQCHRSFEHARNLMQFRGNF